MADDLYEEVDQRVFMVREESPLTPYKGTKVTALGANYPFLIPLNILPGGFDYKLPRRLKEKLYGPGGGKHPLAVVDTKQEPVTFTLETRMQTAIFLAYAVAANSSSVTPSHTQAEAGTIECVADVSDSLDGTYFLIESIDGSGDEQTYCVWIDVDDSGTSYPGPTDIDAGNRKEITGIATNDTAATVATQIEATLETLDIVSSVDSATITYACDNSGAVMHARDGGSAPCGFTFAVTTKGATTHTVLEGTGRSLPTFTLHIEQNQDTDAEDIGFDLFGCVVNDYTCTIDYENGLVQETVEIMCPHYTVNSNNNVELPPMYDSDHDPHAWVSLIEAASNYLLMSGTTDATPKIVTKAELKISNNVVMKPEIGVSYCEHHIAGKRDVSLQIIGYADNSDRITDFLDTWTNNSATPANSYYTTRAARLNSVLKLQRDATYDNFALSIYNWLIDSHNFRIFPIDEGILGLDITLTGATPDSNRRLISSFVIKDYLQDYQYE